MATSVVSNVIYPPLIKKIKEFGNLQITKKQWNNGIAFIAAMIFGFAFIALSSDFLITFFAGVKYLKSAEIFNILLLFVIIQALSVPIKLILYAFDKEKLILLIVMPLPLLKIIFNYFGFELFGVHGIAYSTVIIYLIYFLVMLVASKDLLKKVLERKMT